LTIFLSHIFYRITFIQRINSEFELIEQISLRNVKSTDFFVESPIFALLGYFLKIDSFDTYLLFTYMISMILLFLIVINLSFLKAYSTFFIMSGWLLTTSWFMGHVDIFTVLLILLLCKNIYKTEFSLTRYFVYFLLLTINHNGLAIICLIIFPILFDKAINFKNIISSTSGVIFGSFIISQYLSWINFEGRGRFRFIFNENVIFNSINFLAENMLTVFWSGFLGFTIVFIIFSLNGSWEDNRKIITSLIICLFFTSIALDTSRIFSLSIVPIIIFTIKSIQESYLINQHLSKIYLSSVISLLVIGPKYIHGKFLPHSPNDNMESFYNFIPRIVNSIMSNVWN